MIAKMSEKEDPEEIEKAFELFKEENSDVITFESLKEVAIDLGENIDDDELREMLYMACKDKYGSVTMEGFKTILLRKGINS